MNVQGDEPSIPTANIDQIIELLKENSKNQIVTLCEPIADKEEFFNPDVVKVVTSRNGYALYFLGHQYRTLVIRYLANRLSTTLLVDISAYMALAFPP